MFGHNPKDVDVLPGLFRGEIEYVVDEEEEQEIVFVGIPSSGDHPGLAVIMLPLLDAVRLAAMILGATPDDRLELAREWLEDETND